MSAPIELGSLPLDGAESRTIPASPAAHVALARVANAGSRALVHFVLPVLLTTAFVRYFVPTRAEAEGTWAAPLAKLGQEHTIAVWIALFFLFGCLARYWSFALPALRGARTKSSIFGTIIVVGVAAAAGLLVRGTFGSFRVLGGSMLPTLEPEDVVGGRPLAFAAGSIDPRSLPERGDIVVFRKPSGMGGSDELVKRVVGLPGDRITMNAGHPVINGWEVPSCDAGPYFFPLPDNGGVVGRLYVEFLDGRAHLMIHAHVGPEWQGPYDVNAGEVFVLGDNRNNSSDSRAFGHGAGAGLPVEAIDAHVEGWLFGLRRDDHVDLAHVLHPLELFVRLDGIDTGPQRQGIADCMKRKPAETSPPHPRAAATPGGPSVP